MRHTTSLRSSSRTIACDYVLRFLIVTTAMAAGIRSQQTQVHTPIIDSSEPFRLKLLPASLPGRPDAEWINHATSTVGTTTSSAGIVSTAATSPVSDTRLPVISGSDRAAISVDHITEVPLVSHQQKMDAGRPAVPAHQVASPDATESLMDPPRMKEAKGMHRREIGESLPYPAGGQADRWGSAGYNHGRSTGEFSMDAPPLMEDDVLHQHLPTPAEEEEQSNEGTFFGVLETNVTASIGETAFLRCRLQKTQHQVTWIRTRDWHVLTAGLLTYTADARFRVKHAAEASEWTLEIKYLQKKDDGTYYCQVPTKTGTAVHAFHLHVASPQAVILGGEVSHVDIHTPSFTLVCIIDNTPNAPQFVFWYHNGTLLKDGKYPENSGHSNGGGGLISTHMTLTSSRAMSMLTLHNIQHLHSGNYTCSAPNAQSDSTHLFVTQRHEQAAVHRSNSAATSQPHNLRLVHIASLIGHVLVVRRKCW